VTNPTAELEDLERQGWLALSSPDGAAFYEDVMADDGLMVFPGSVLDKTASVNAIRAAPPWGRFELADTIVVHPTPDTAIVAYRATATRGDAAPYHALMTSTYARREGRWRLVVHQQSPSP
jgi:uncharacterized protein (TIGR02246 family)